MKNIHLSFVFIALLAVILTSAAGATRAEAQTDVGAAVASDAADTSDTAQENATSEGLIEKLKQMFHLSKSKRPTEQDKAARLARNGHYDEALAIYDRLHQAKPDDQSVTRDMVAVLGWAGRDQASTDLYESLPAVQPDYVLASVGHSYRNLGHADKALAVYRLGMKQSPNRVIFAEGEVRCLADLNKLDEALAHANADIGKNGSRAEMAAAKKDLLVAVAKRDQEAAVELARSQQYGMALPILAHLHSQFPDDLSITQDYLSVASWAGGNDRKVIELYKALPSGDQPDYVLKSVGAAYRKVHQFDEAQKAYQQGLSKYPDDVVFAEGVIRTLVDQKKYNEALVLADQDLQNHGGRPEIVDIRRNIERLKKSAARHHKKKR